VLLDVDEVPLGVLESEVFVYGAGELVHGANLGRPALFGGMTRSPAVLGEEVR
jgi:hypothetical protein